MFHNIPPTSPRKAHEKLCTYFSPFSKFNSHLENKLCKTLNWTLISKKYLHRHSLDCD